MTAAEREMGHTVAAALALSTGNQSAASAELDAAIDAGLSQMEIDSIGIHDEPNFD